MIYQIRTKTPVSKRGLISRAKFSLDFIPILERLKRRLPKETIYKMLIHKVRSLVQRGHCNVRFGSQQITQDLINLSDTTQIYFQGKFRHKSIFFLKQDELIFRNVFRSNQSSRNNQVARKRDVNGRINDIRFTHVLQRLRNVYCDDFFEKFSAKFVVLELQNELIIDVKFSS